MAKKTKWQYLKPDHNNWVLEQVRKRFPKYRIVQRGSCFRLYVQITDFGIPVDAINLTDPTIQNLLEFADENPLI